jgi:hypothetical protein
MLTTLAISLLTGLLILVLFTLGIHRMIIRFEEGSRRRRKHMAKVRKGNHDIN